VKSLCAFKLDTLGNLSGFEDQILHALVIIYSIIIHRYIHPLHYYGRRLIYGHLWVVGVIEEDGVLFKDFDKVLEACRVNSEMGSWERTISGRLCAILVDFAS
jgi:hypothetical protein